MLQNLKKKIILFNHKIASFCKYIHKQIFFIFCSFWFILPRSLSSNAILRLVCASPLQIQITQKQNELQVECNAFAADANQFIASRGRTREPVALDARTRLIRPATAGRFDCQQRSWTASLGTNEYVSTTRCATDAHVQCAAQHVCTRRVKLSGCICY